LIIAFAQLAEQGKNHSIFFSTLSRRKYSRGCWHGVKQTNNFIAQL